MTIRCNQLHCHTFSGAAPLDLNLLRNKPPHFPVPVQNNSRTKDIFLFLCVC